MMLRSEIEREKPHRETFQSARNQRESHENRHKHRAQTETFLNENQNEKR